MLRMGWRWWRCWGGGPGGGAGWEMGWGGLGGGLCLRCRTGIRLRLGSCCFSLGRLRGRWRWRGRAVRSIIWCSLRSGMIMCLLRRGFTRSVGIRAILASFGGGWARSWCWGIGFVSWFMQGFCLFSLGRGSGMRRDFWSGFLGRIMSGIGRGQGCGFLEFDDVD